MISVSAFRFIQPCSPIRAKEVPAGEGWLHEVKFDGYRVQVHKVGSCVIIYSRASGVVEIRAVCRYLLSPPLL